MKVTFLGTAGSIMAENKGYPAILINQDLLLDCGEGTTQKLVQLKLIEQVEIICITHLHNDHFIGIFSLLWHLWIARRSRNLEIIGPTGLINTVETILALINTPEYLRSFEINYTEIDTSEGSQQQLVREHYIIKIIEVEHGIPALAYRVEQGEKKLCYTGDTKPNKGLNILAKRCDLLISESTLPTKLTKYAHQHHHMTPVDAARLAMESKCEKLVLIHVSSFFLDQIEDFKAEAGRIFKKEVVIAKDLMELEIS